MNTVDKVIAVAANEVGYLEKKSNYLLDDKTANAGYNNWTKYARDIDNIQGYFNGAKNGYAWCAVFVNWCFIKAYGVSEAKRLLCQPTGISYAAGCHPAYNYFKAKGQLYHSPQIGDQIFFFTSGGIEEIGHTGIVYKVDANYVYTIEGNTSSASGVVPNGGAVAYKSYHLNYSRIAGYGRPKYDIQPKQEVKEEMRFTYLKDVKSQEYRNTLNKLISKGIIKGKGGSGEDLIIDLGEDAIRLLVYLDREGIFN